MESKERHLVHRGKWFSVGRPGRQWSGKMASGGNWDGQGVGGAQLDGQGASGRDRGSGV